MEIRKYFPKCFDKRKNNIEITNSQENYEQQNVSYKLWGTVKVIVRRNYMASNAFLIKEEKIEKKKISVHI